MIIWRTTCGCLEPDCLWITQVKETSCLPEGMGSASSKQEECKTHHLKLPAYADTEAGGHPSDYLGKIPETPRFSPEGTSRCELVTG